MNFSEYRCGDSFVTAVSHFVKKSPRADWVTRVVATEASADSVEATVHLRRSVYTIKSELGLWALSDKVAFCKIFEEALPGIRDTDLLYTMSDNIGRRSRRRNRDLSFKIILTSSGGKPIIRVGDLVCLNENAITAIPNDTRRGRQNSLELAKFCVIGARLLVYSSKRGRVGIGLQNEGKVPYNDSIPFLRKIMEDRWLGEVQYTVPVEHISPVGEPKYSMEALSQFTGISEGGRGVQMLEIMRA